MNGLSNLFKQTIKEKEVYLFSSDQISTDVPHMFVVIMRIGDLLILSCAKSSPDKSLERIKNNNFPSQTLVKIPSKHSDPNSPFDKDTYIDCNTKTEHTIDQLAEKLDQKKLHTLRNLPDKYYQEIVNGLILSPEIDDDLKEQLQTLR